VHTARLTPEEALAGLRSARGGLESREAARRATEYGPNRVEEAKREPALLRLARQFTHFFALILWVAAGLAFAAEAFDPGQGMATLGVAIVGVIAINGAFAFWQEARAERTVAALRALGTIFVLTRTIADSVSSASGLASGLALSCAAAASGNAASAASNSNKRMVMTASWAKRDADILASPLPLCQKNRGQSPISAA